MKRDRDQADLLKAGERHLLCAIRRCPETPTRDHDDLAQELRLHLFLAGKRYSSPQVAPSTYSARLIDRKIRQYQIDDKRRAKLPTQPLEGRYSCEASSPGVEAPDPAPAPDQALFACDVRAFLDACVRELPAFQRRMIVDVYGWHSGAPRSLTSVARSLNITRETARWSLSLAHRSLRKRCEQHGLTAEDLLDALEKSKL